MNNQEEVQVTVLFHFPYHIVTKPMLLAKMPSCADAIQILPTCE